MGKKTDIGAFTYIQAEEGVEIGDNVQIGSHCSIYSVSTIDDKRGKVVLGENSKVGSHTTIMPNVEIGENTIIGAHSFVNCSIPANCIAWGVPAKIKTNENTAIQNKLDREGYFRYQASSKIRTKLGEWQIGGKV